MKYFRRQNLNLSNILDDTVLQTAVGNIELNPTQKVTIRGDLEILGGAVPGPEVTNTKPDWSLSKLFKAPGTTNSTHSL